MRTRGLFLLILYCLANAVLLRGETFGPVSVTAEPPEALNRREHGYQEYRFQVYNSSPRETCRVTLIAPGRSRGYGDLCYLREMRRSVVLGPSSGARLSLLQPPLSVQGDDSVTVLVNGRTAGEVKAGYHFNSYVERAYYDPYRYAFGSHPSGVPSGTTAPRDLFIPSRVLLGRGVDGQALEDGIFKVMAGPAAAPAGARGSPSTPPPPSARGASAPSFSQYLSLVRAQNEVSGWSPDWLAYTAYDGIVLGAEETAGMPSEVRDALLSYVECGGALLVLGGATWPGLGGRARGPGSMEASHAGFGVCVFSPKGSPASFDREELLFLKRTWNATRAPFVQWQARGVDLNTAFAVIERLAVPARSLFLLLLVFGVVIGPVNILYFYRRKRHLAVFWTIPGVSALATGLVVAHALLSEGTAPTLRLESLTVLDQASRRASTVGMAAYYSPVAWKDGLRFNPRTEATPLGRFVSEGSVDWTADQHFRSGWIRPKIPAHFMVRKSEMRRERLEVTYSGGKATALNGLSADIEELWVCGSGGSVYGGKNIRAGARAGLESSGQVQPSSGPENLRQAYQGEWNAIGSRMGRRDLLLRPGSYLAVIRASPFLEKGLAHRRGKEKIVSYVFGILEQ